MYVYIYVLSITLLFYEGTQKEEGWKIEVKNLREINEFFGFKFLFYTGPRHRVER